MSQPSQSVMHSGEILPLIQQLERRDLDHAQPRGAPIWGPAIEKPDFVQVQGLARFWAQDAADDDGLVDYAQHMGDLITGLHASQREVSYLVLGEEQGVGVFMSLAGQGQANAMLRRSLSGILPGVELAPQAVTGLGVKHNQLGTFGHFGVLTGIPTPKLTPNPQDGRGTSQQIERLLRGMQGQRWGYLVQATAIPQSTSLSLVYQGLSQVTRVSALVTQQVSYQDPSAKAVGHVVQTTSVSHDQTNYDAKYCLELLERNLVRLQIGKAEGMWQVKVYFFAAQADLRDQLGALMRSAFSGSDSIPDPIRVLSRDAGSSTKDEQYHTLLNSREVAVLCQLPRTEFPGYAIRDYARFDTDLPQPRPQHPVALGRITDSGRLTSQKYAVNRSDLTKHGLIAGVTGSGKTTTVFSLLDRLHDGGRGLPFLVIEPAKTEYRNLLKAQGRFPNLRIYTLGDERYAPFRLNPFEFAIGDAEHRIHVQTHIDFLKAVFNAAFVLYAPMPYVLETCLHEVYTDRGWDLSTGLNLRLPEAQQGKERAWPVFPTLTDLYHKIDAVVFRLGYEERIEMDVQAGLKARIGSLRLGGKGFMLDCRTSLPMGDLLAYPTILEMAHIGNEDEKAFILGLILTSLYEFYVVQSQMTTSLGGDLVHLTVIEEAHRLLKNVSTEVDTESSNTKGQAVETFTNMLSEIRAYGEGVLIAEQIPIKLAPDAVKNTNLKIVHRLLAGDDREVLAATMNMNEAQSRYLTTLKPGQAVVHAEGADHPYLLYMDNFKMTIAGKVSDGDVRQRMSAFIDRSSYYPIPSFSVFFPAKVMQLLAQQKIGMSVVRDHASRLLEHPEFQQHFDRYILGIISRPQQAVFTFGWLKPYLAYFWIETDLSMPVALYAMLSAIDDHSERRGQQYRWGYHRISNAYVFLNRALSDIATNYPYGVTDRHQSKQTIEGITARVEPDLIRFQSAYRRLTEADPPYPTCQFCQSRCQYRFEAMYLAEQTRSKEDFGHIFESFSDDKKLWADLKEYAEKSAMQMVMENRPQVPRDAKLCILIHSMQKQKINVSSQLKLLRNIGQQL